MFLISLSPKVDVNNRLLHGSEGKKQKLLCRGDYRSRGYVVVIADECTFGIATCLTKIHIVRLSDCLSLAAKWIRRNWNSDFGNYSCIYFASETFLFIVVGKIVVFHL